MGSSAQGAGFFRAGFLAVKKHLHHDARFAWVPQPKRSCRHLLLDHLNLHGGCHDVLLDGKHERFPPLAHPLSSIGTSIGLSRFLCKWSNSISFSRQSNPILEQECSSVCSWEPVRCWLSVTLARLISSTLGRDSSSAWAAGHTSCSRSLQVKLARNQLLWVATSRLPSTS